MTTRHGSRKVIDNSQVQQASPIDECIALVKQAQTAFGVNPPSLSKVAKRHLAKPRTNSAEIITIVARLATEHGVSLPKHSVGTMLKNLQTVQALAPLKAAVTALQKIVDDSMLSANGDAWSSATSFYSVLHRVDDKDAALEAALEPLATIFKKGRKPQAKKSTNASENKVTPSSPSPSASEAESSGAAAVGGASTSHA